MIYKYGQVQDFSKSFTHLESSFAFVGWKIAMSVRSLYFVLLSVLLVSNCLGRNLIQDMDDDDDELDLEEELMARNIFSKIGKAIKNQFTFKSTAAREEELRECMRKCTVAHCKILAGGADCGKDKKGYDDCVNKCYHP